MSTDEAIESFFSACRVRTLRSVLDEGDIGAVVEREEIEAYCRLAATAWTEGLPTATQKHRDEMNDLYGRLVFAILTAEGEIYREICGEPFVVMPGGNVVEVTDARMRHWEWTWRIVHDEELARRLLLEAPDGIGATAVNRVTFNTIVGGMSS